MPFQIAEPGEAQSTLPAGEGLLPRVPELVRVPAAPLAEAHVADVAEEGLLPSVRANVIGQHLRGAEALPTYIAAARSQVGVGLLLVVLQDEDAREDGVTVLAREPAHAQRRFVA